MRSLRTAKGRFASLSSAGGSDKPHDKKSRAKTVKDVQARAREGIIDLPEKCIQLLSLSRVSVFKFGYDCGVVLELTFH